MDAFIYDILQPLPTGFLIVFIIFFLYLIGKGADILVDEAVSLSLHWGVPKMVVGATIVSMGTTLPEAAVSVMAAISGNPDLALGNAVGSIVADTGLIIGASALLGHLPVDEGIVKKQGKIQYLACFLLVFFSLPFKGFSQEGKIFQWMGFVLLFFLVLYMYFSLKWARTSSEDTNISEERSPVFFQILKLILGISLVIFSSKILIPSVEISAVRIGIPQGVIAATLIAFGTSLPELVTAITAVRKGHGELAVGNIVGADILNVLFVVGAAAAVTPSGLQVPISFYKLQFPAMLVIVLSFRHFTKNADKKISKIEGLFLMSIYFIYIFLNFWWL